MITFCCSKSGALLNGVWIWSGINTSYLTMDISVDVLDTPVFLREGQFNNNTQSSEIKR